MKSSQHQRFTIASYAGVDLDQLAGKPPGSAKLVAYIDFGSGPGGGDYRTYFLSTDKKRSGIAGAPSSHWKFNRLQAQFAGKYREIRRIWAAMSRTSSSAELTTVH